MNHTAVPIVSFLCSLLLYPVFLCGTIRECATIEEVLVEAQLETLVILDIDNTLLRPCQMLGSDEWFQYYLKYQTSLLGNEQAALLRTLDLLRAIYATTNVMPMEKQTATVVHELQKKGTIMMGLTNRGPDAANMTFRHLGLIDIGLGETSPCKASFTLWRLPGTLYQRGILFTDGKNKREALSAFFQQLSWTPKRIVYINDHRKYLEEVSAFEKEGVSFIGLRYSVADIYLKNFDPKASDAQLEAFSTILPDSAVKSRSN